MLGLKQFVEISASWPCLPNQYFQQEKKKSPEIFSVSVALQWAMFGATIVVPAISHLPYVCKGQRAVEDTHR